MRVMFQSSAVISNFSLESVVNIKHCYLFIAFRSQDIGNWLSISFRQIGALVPFPDLAVVLHIL